MGRRPPEIERVEYKLRIEKPILDRLRKYAHDEQISVNAAIGALVDRALQVRGR